MEEKKLRESNPQNDDIDLTKVISSFFAFIGRIIRGILKFIFHFIDKLYQKKKLIFFLLLIGISLGAFNYFNTKPFYESRMTLSSAYYKGEFLDNSIQNLNRLCSEGNYNVLAKLLSIPSQKAKTLKQLEVDQVISPKLKLLIDLYKDKEGSQHRLDSMILYHNDSTYQIKVQVYDTTTLIGLDTILVNYIKNNKFVEKRIQIERRNLLNRKNKLIRESKNLDTLKNYIARSYITGSSGKEGTNVTLNDKEANPIDIYREDFRFFDQQLHIDRLLYLNSEIEIIDRFITFGKPANETLIRNILKGALLGLGLAVLIIFIQVIKKAMIKLRYLLYKQ